ncbi:hypothetical protein [Effusibacillus lacus]|uniref:Uncharacterized protein n=1 Tax=Effusibacillus lacus TaxID=1348429 RepID=A0A292YPH5_9BACL|nr:hypothetical protein [Effusibacillus lacus]TCS76589.1 hypothetical protein EDD64_102135 [Effusibacillus lacus]GAX90395.1 hypothetical protein EFBL_2022 [Effusibacillus lacus]
MSRLNQDKVPQKATAKKVAASKPVRYAKKVSSDVFRIGDHVVGPTPSGRMAKLKVVAITRVDIDKFVI